MIVTIGTFTASNTIRAVPQSQTTQVGLQHRRADAVLADRRPPDASAFDILARRIRIPATVEPNVARCGRSRGIGDAMDIRRLKGTEKKEIL